MKMSIIAAVKRRIELCQPKLFEKDTGLEIYVYYRVKPDEKHKFASIKVSKIDSDCSDSNSATISVSKNPTIVEPPDSHLLKIGITTKLLKQVKTWIVLNQDPLLKFWKGEITEKQFKSTITKLPKDWKIKFKEEVE